MSLSRPTLAAMLAAVMSCSLVVVAWRTGALASAAVRNVTWTPVASQPYSTVEAAGLSLNGKLYSFGGFDSVVYPKAFTPTARSYVYDPQRDAWSAIAPLPAFNGAANPGVSHAGITTDGTSIYIAGGYSASNSAPGATPGQIFGARDVFRYNPGADTYTVMPPLPTERGAGVLEYSAGELHFMGGVNRKRDRESPEHWALDLAHPSAGWVARAPMPTPRNHLASAVVDGKIYVIGGQTGQDENSISSNVVNRYDPRTNSWETLPPLPRVLNHTVATVLHGDIIVMGGQSTFNQPRTSTYAYDPLTNAWTEFTPLPDPRFSGTPGTIGDSVYFAGGHAKKGFSAVTWRGTPVPLGETPGPSATPTPPPAATSTPAPATNAPATNAPATSTPGPQATPTAGPQATGTPGAPLGEPITAAPAGSTAAPSGGAVAPAAGASSPAAPAAPTPRAAALTGGHLVLKRLALARRPGASCPSSATLTLRAKHVVVTRTVKVTAATGGCRVTTDLVLPKRLAHKPAISVSITGKRLHKTTLRLTQ